MRRKELSKKAKSPISSTESGRFRWLMGVSEKAFLPMRRTCFGMSIRVSMVVFSRLSAISVREAGRCICSRLIHSWKAPLPIVATASGTSMRANEAQKRKASSPMTLSD